MKIVVIVNKNEIFNLCYYQIPEKNLIKIDNTKNQYENFRDAIESVLDYIADNETVIIAHQDVILYDLLDKIETYTIEPKNLYGVVGVGKFRKRPTENLIGSVANAGKNLNVTVPEKPVEVENIDECVLVLNGKTLKENIFRLERSWHLYAVEFGLLLKTNGGKIIVLPCNIIHLSSGKYDKDYYETISKLLEKYRVDRVWTTCGVWNRKSVRKTFPRIMRIRK